MKKIGIRAASLLFALFLCCTPALAVELLIPVGQAVGLELQSQGVTVAAVDKASPGEKAGLLTGDVILKVNDIPADTAEILVNTIKNSAGEVTLLVQRDGETVKLLSQPQDGRLGISVRKGMAGIGTITYYDPDTGAFGALGHGVSNSDGSLIPMDTGSVLQASVASVEKGKIGKPGRLKGAFAKDEIIGALQKNTVCGVFGKSQTGWKGIPMPVAEPEEVSAGAATILSNVSGTEVQEYSVEIMKVYPDEETQCRNLLLRVTDERLLNTTGGIVQGMSGSPILQNGRFVGAVTHVLVNDPTMGYGIFVENMLDAAA